jgi:SAM-dependent methyltransferase
MKPVLFDDQADAFDKRVGLPPRIPEKVAAALVEFTGFGNRTAWVEIGAGTGEIGAEVSGLVGRYAGVDRSFPMLTAFRRRGTARAVQADGNAAWPFPDGSVDVVFGFRSLHHLRPEHLVAEVERITRGRKAAVVAGGILRDDAGVKEQMRRHMRQLLKARGLRGREGGRGKADWKPELEACGWRSAGTLQVADWETAPSPGQCLRSWAGKAGLAGLEVDEALKAEVLRDVEAWAKERFGDLEMGRTEREVVVLEAFKRDS